MPLLTQRQKSWGNIKPPVWGRLNRASPVAPKSFCFLFNEGAGTTAYNRADVRNNGTLSGPNVRWVAGRGGKAVDLNSGGSTSKITTADIPLGTTCWFALWINPRVNASSYCGLITNNVGSAGLYYRGASRLLDMVYTPGGDHLSSTALTVGKWTHVALSINAGSGTFYVNGKADGTFSSWPGTTLQSIGNDASSDLYNGLVESAMGSSGEYLTAAEVWRLYTDRYVMFLPPPPARLVRTVPVVLPASSSGGITFGGSSAPSITYPLATSGGIEFGGSSAPALTFPLSSSGGITFGGSSVVTLTLPPNLIGAVIQFCQNTPAISSLLPGGIWHNVAKATVMPFVTFTGISSRKTFNLSDSYFENDLIQFCVYASTDLEASNIADVIASQLSPKTGNTKLSWTSGYEMSRFPGNATIREMPERFKGGSPVWQDMREVEFLAGASF